MVCRCCPRLIAISPCVEAWSIRSKGGHVDINQGRAIEGRSRLLLLFGRYCGAGPVHLPLWVALQRGLLLLTLMVLLIGMLGIPYPGVCSLLISQLFFLSASRRNGKSGQLGYFLSLCAGSSATTLTGVKSMISFAESLVTDSIREV